MLENINISFTIEGKMYIKDLIPSRNIGKSKSMVNIININPPKSKYHNNRLRGLSTKLMYVE